MAHNDRSSRNGGTFRLSPSIHMPIKLSRVLPPINVALAVTLLQWGYHSRPPVVLDTMWVSTPTLVCYGVNAPAFRISGIVDKLLSSLPNDLFSKVPHSGDILLVIVAAMFWYLVGRRIDHSRSSSAAVESAHGRKIAWDFLILLYGLTLLIVICLHNVIFTNPRNNSYADNNFLGELIFQGLWLVWSLILIIVPGRDLFRAIRRRKHDVFVPNSTATR
jgi:hypothetical protein